MPSTFPYRTGLAELLGKRGITSRRLADAIGYTTAAVRAWRAGRWLPQHGARVLLANYLGVSEAKLRALLELLPPA